MPFICGCKLQRFNVDLNQLTTQTEQVSVFRPHRLGSRTDFCGNELRQNRDEASLQKIFPECVRPWSELMVEAATDDGSVQVNSEFLHAIAELGSTAVSSGHYITE